MTVYCVELYKVYKTRITQVWRSSDGVLCRTLQGHGHWVNSMALSTDYATRIGCWDPALQGLFFLLVGTVETWLLQNSSSNYI